MVYDCVVIRYGMGRGLCCVRVGLDMGRARSLYCGSGRGRGDVL